MIKAYGYINNQFIKGKNKINIYSILDNKTKLGIVCSCSSVDVDKAYEAAYKCFLSYKNKNLDEKKIIINKIKKVLQQNDKYLAKLISMEIAKPYQDSLDEIWRSIQYIDETIKVYEQMISNPLNFNEEELKVKGKFASYSLEPLGVILCIVPFNYPINLLISKIIPALISGNSIVIKCSLKSSLVTYEFIRLLAQEKGIDKGLINLIVGSSKQHGEALIKNQRLAMVNFTGSSEIGLSITSKLKNIPVVLEMGGKDAAIVLKDANLEKTTDEIIKGAFSFNGQRCTAIKRVIVDASIANQLIEKLNLRIKTLKCSSDPFEKQVIITPLISKETINLIKTFIDDAISKGAKLNQPLIIKKNMVYPMLLTNIKTNMLVWKKEQFAPILPLIKFKNQSELIKLTNDTDYGLQTSIFTSNIDEAIKIAKSIDVGTVNINKSSSRGPDILPFLGVKNSGFGVQGIAEAIKSMTRLKGIVINK